VTSTAWNRLRYTLYTPVYDLVAKHFATYRQRSIQLLDIQEGQKVLLIGAGTGLDLPYINSQANITATDITPSMISSLQERAAKLELAIDAKVMDGQKLKFADETFDAVILHLILAVIPDPVACIREAERVTKPGGKLVVFDKFLPDNQQPNMSRRVLNFFINLLATNINRKMGVLLANTHLEVRHQEPAALNGTFQIYVLEREKLELR
jgi:ubiquinone/menaquinone biosynthesis C-methylase UbiE